MDIQIKESVSPMDSNGKDSSRHVLFVNGEFYNSYPTFAAAETKRWELLANNHNLNWRQA